MPSSIEVRLLHCHDRPFRYIGCASVTTVAVSMIIIIRIQTGHLQIDQMVVVVYM
jgi:hypothetical protein